MGEHRNLRRVVFVTDRDGETTCVGVGCRKKFYSEDKTRVRYCRACRIKLERFPVGKVACQTTAMRGSALVSRQCKRPSK